ncbi:MAG TPA: hypothetical protein VK797_06115, partial [Tepidisphaeraceae bacterium]|nr:hypothetical protein [Tepidisphaeraceae bacterium]
DWTGSVSVIDLSNGVTIPVSATHMPAYNELVFGLNNSTELSDANYAVILHGSQLQGATTGLSVVGNDGVAGDDSTFNFFFQESDFNHDRNTNSADLQTVLADLNHPGTFSGGDSNYDGYVNSADMQDVLFFLNKSLPLLGTPGTPTAYVASSSSLDIEWTTASDPSVTEYDLYRNSSLVVSDVTDTGYLDTGLLTNTTYAYFVVGKDANNDSSWQSPELLAAIAPATPTLSLSGDSTVTEGDTYYLGGAFGDANNDEPNQWNISWGDGTSASYSGFADAVLDSNDSIGGPAGAFHTYSEGTYTITGTAYGDVGTLAANSVVVDVTDATPTFSVLGDSTMVQGQPYSITTSFTDFDTQNSWTVAWGDGTTASSGTGAIPAGLTHTYSSGAGAPYTIVANVVTNDGTYTNTTTVDEAMPTLTVTGGASVAVGSTYTLTDSFSDPAGQTPASWSIDWGDGSSPTTLSGDPTTATHVYSQTLANSGAYTIAAYAVDGDGAYYATPDEVAVTPAAPTASLSPSGQFTAGYGAVFLNQSANPANDTIAGWTIAWGDGAASEYVGNPPQFQHTYQLPGDFAVTALAQWAGGNATEALSVPVSDASAFGLNASNAATQKTPYEVEMDFFPVGAEIPTGYTINWGDGTLSAYGTDPDMGGEFTHIYQSYGGVTITAELDTNATTYTSMVPVMVGPNLSFSLDGPGLEESGAPLDLTINYGGVAPFPTYTLGFDDGTTAIGNAPTLSHAFTFNPHWPTASNTYTENFRHFSLTASEGTSSTTVYGEVEVLPGGSGTVDPQASTGQLVEGQPVTFGATLADSQFVDGHNPNAEWYFDGLDLGGSNDSNPPVGDVLSFGLAGTYTVRWDAVYEDAGADAYGDSQDFDAFATQAVVIQHATPTLTVSGDPTELVGLPYGVDELFQAAPGSAETVQQWTIDWGDGHSSATGSSFTHDYTAPGNYNIQVSAQTNEGFYSTALSVTVEAPTVSFGTTSGAAYEQFQSANRIVLSRSYGYDPLTVNFSTAGTANSSEYELTDANTGQILTGSVTFPAGSDFATILVTAREDNTPAWTDTLDLTLTSGADYTLAGPTTDETDIVNDDLGVTLGDGSGNIILDGSSDGTQNLVPLVLDYPPELDGASLTLSISNDTEADVWSTPTPGSSDTPILGDVNGTYVSSLTWAGGVNYPTEQTFWVGGTGGSMNVGDLAFTLSGSDANAATRPASPTTESTVSNKASDIRVHIVVEQPNDGITQGTFIEGKTEKWMVGQIVDIEATVYGPTGIITAPTISWNIPGNVLFDYVGSLQSATAIPLSPVNIRFAAPFHFDTVGTQCAEVQFFWAMNLNGGGTGDAPEAQSWPVSVTVGPIAGRDFTASTTFTVEEPTSSLAVTKQGSTTLHTAPKDLSKTVSLGDEDAQPFVNAIEIRGNVQLPTDLTAFGAGTWEILQLVDPNETGSYINGSNQNIALHSPLNGMHLLDGSYPYPGYLDPQGLPNIIENPIFPTGSASTMVDLTGLPALQPARVYRPGGILVKDVTLTQASADNIYEDYLMFKPPGASSWVPVVYEKWYWQVSVSLQAGNKYAYNGNPFGPSPDPPLSFGLIEPEWTAAIVLGSKDLYFWTN